MLVLSMVCVPRMLRLMLAVVGVVVSYGIVVYIGVDVIWYMAVAEVYMLIWLLSVMLCMMSLVMVGMVLMCGCVGYCMNVYVVVGVCYMEVVVVGGIAVVLVFGVDGYYARIGVVSVVGRDVGVGGRGVDVVGVLGDVIVVDDGCV